MHAQNTHTHGITNAETIALITFGVACCSGFDQLCRSSARTHACLNSHTDETSASHHRPTQKHEHTRKVCPVPCMAAAGSSDSCVWTRRFKWTEPTMRPRRCHVQENGAVSPTQRNLRECFLLTCGTSNRHAREDKTAATQRPGP